MGHDSIFGVRDSDVGWGRLLAEVQCAGCVDLFAGCVRDVLFSLAGCVRDVLISVAGCVRDVLIVFRAGCVKSRKKNNMIPQLISSPDRTDI